MTEHTITITEKEREGFKQMYKANVDLVNGAMERLQPGEKHSAVEVWREGHQACKAFIKRVIYGS